MNTRTECSAVRFTEGWDDTFVHRSYTGENLVFRSVLCYGRQLGPMDLSDVDEPVTCLTCLGSSLYTMEISPLRPMQRRPGYSLDPLRRFREPDEDR